MTARTNENARFTVPFSGGLGISPLQISSPPAPVPFRKIVVERTPAQRWDQRQQLLKNVSRGAGQISGNSGDLIFTVAPSSPAYTQDMTGSAWDAFMNQPRAVAIRRQQALFMKMRERFYAEYEGKTVAFADGKILDSDTDERALLLRTRELRQERPVLIISVRREYLPVEM